MAQLGLHDTLLGRISFLLLLSTVLPIDLALALFLFFLVDRAMRDVTGDFKARITSRTPQSKFLFDNLALAQSFRRLVKHILVGPILLASAIIGKLRDFPNLSSV